MEKGALVGMMSLAASDLFFCIVTICGAHLPAAKMIYHQRDFVFYYTLYSNYIQNVLIKTSAWFTVILAASRHFVVCHPITARKYLKCKHTLAAIIICILMWILLHIPLIFMWKTYTVNCSGKFVYILTSGYYAETQKLKTASIYTWFVLGFLLPVVILAYCNTQLIRSLKISRKFKNRDGVDAEKNQTRARMDTNPRNKLVVTSSVVVKKSNQDKNQRRITYTLITIVISFFICILPSEIVQFYAEIKKPDYTGIFRFILNFANFIQAINFSCNFVLYCIVNAYFRKTLKNWFKWIYKGCSKRQERSKSKYSSYSQTSHMTEL